MQTDYIYTQEYDNTFQLVLPLEVGKKIPDNSPVRTFCNLFQQISMEGIVEKKISHMGRKSFNQVILLKLVLYGYMIGIRSSREIKRACDVNIEFMYLLNGFDAPSHSTINTFINNSNSKIDEIFLRVIDAIMDNENINLDNLYIDGTKIEAFSNKYTFVWRGRIMHGIYGLMGKINKIWNDLEIFLNESDRNKLLRYIEQPKEYRKGMKFKYYSRNRLMLIRKALRKTIKSEKIEFVFGKGKRKTKIQRVYEVIDDAYNKLCEYEKDFKIMGKDRNSYAKTDVDATFMHMKEDHMQNTQLKPGYNMQVGVADEYIVVTDVYQNRNDFGTFVPLLEKFRNFYCRMPINPVADAGYGSFDNYKYCETEKMNKSMKFNLYEQKRSNKYKQDIYNKDNFGISDNNYPVCPAGIEFKYTGTRKGRTKHDDDFYKVYVCPDCTGCNHAKKCKKSDNNRSIHINEKLDEYQKEAIEFLDTQLGKELRCKRSAQAEGAFGIIKGNSEFNRLRRKGMEQVKIEWSLICIGYNLMKFHNKLIR